MKSILDRTFRYTPSLNTDLRKTFARIRRQQCKERRAVHAATCENVLSITRASTPPENVAKLRS
jgi:hypothetical protein